MCTSVSISCDQVVQYWCTATFADFDLQRAMVGHTHDVFLRAQNANFIRGPDGNRRAFIGAMGSVSFEASSVIAHELEKT
jgi:hypothetical protein